MKRIITCPKCEAKLSVFDLGKPINQKCPKCGNTFVVESTEKTTDPAKRESTEGEAGEAAKKDAAAPADDMEKTSDVPAAPAGGKKEDGPQATQETTLKKPPERPAAAKAPATPPEAPLPYAEPAPGGHSMLFSATVVGLLLLLAVMQAMMKMRSEKQYKALIGHLQRIEAKLVK